MVRVRSSLIFLFLALIYVKFLSIMYFNISLFQSIFQVIFGASVQHQDTTPIGHGLHLVCANEQYYCPTCDKLCHVISCGMSKSVPHNETDYHCPPCVFQQPRTHNRTAPRARQPPAGTTCIFTLICDGIRKYCDIFMTLITQTYTEQGGDTPLYRVATT